MIDLQTMENEWQDQKRQLAAAQARESELLAHVERLRRILECTIANHETGMSRLIQKLQADANREELAATPAQSFTSLRNEVLEEAAKMCNLGPQWPLSDFEQGCEYMATTLADAIRAMKEQE